MFKNIFPGRCNRRISLPIFGLATASAVTAYLLFRLQSYEINIIPQNLVHYQSPLYTFRRVKNPPQTIQNAVFPLFVKNPYPGLEPPQKRCFSAYFRLRHTLYRISPHISSANLFLKFSLLPDFDYICSTNISFTTFCYDTFRYRSILFPETDGSYPVSPHVCRFTGGDYLLRQE